MSKHMHSLAASGLVAAFVVALAGCGGAQSDPAVASQGARFAPASSVAYVEIDTQVNGNQWQQADQLLDRFPGRDELFDAVRKELAEHDLNWERDVKPALGDALYVTWLDFQRGGDNYVGFAQPADRAKFERLLAASDEPLVRRDVDGWVVFADSEALLDRFERERSSGSLADEDVFMSAVEGLPADALVRAFLSGAAVQQKLDEALAAKGTAQSVTDRFGKLQSIAAAAGAEGEGVSLAADYASTGAPEVDPYSPSLPDAVPAGPLVYVSFGNVEEAFNRLLQTLEDEAFGFARRREQLELALAFSLRDDLAPLFAKEGGFAIYPAEPKPAYALVLAVDDEDAARQIIERLAGLVELSGEGSTRVDSVDGVRVRVVTYEGMTIFAAVSDGRLIVTTTEVAMRDFLNGGPTLSGDPTFQSASDAADLPGETTGFVYANLDDALPELYEYLGEDASPELRANTKPLESVLVFGEKHDDHQHLSGFVQIQ